MFEFFKRKNVKRVNSWGLSLKKKRKRKKVVGIWAIELCLKAPWNKELRKKSRTKSEKKVFSGDRKKKKKK